MSENPIVTVQDFRNSVNMFFKCDEKEVDLESRYNPIDAQLEFVERMIEALTYGRSTD